MRKNNILIFIISLAVTLITLFSINYISYNDSNTSLSDINIMDTNYKEVRDYALDAYYIDGYKEKIEKLKETFKSNSITARLKYRASLISYLGEEEIIINGIDLNNDKEVFNVVGDSTVKNFNTNNSIVISKSIASVLDLNTNDTVILKLITKTGHYNAEEYTIIEVSENLDYNYALVDINNLNAFIGLENTATEVYVSGLKLENDNDDIKLIFGDDIGIYSKKDILGDDYNTNSNIKRLYIYILIAYLFVLFSVFMFINSHTFYDYDKLLKSKILFSFIGFAVSFVIYIIILKLYYKKEFIFDYMYIFMLIINIVSVLSANLKYFLLEKMFVKKDEEYNKKKNILIILGMVFTYIIALVVLYLSFLGFINDGNNTASEENKETIIRIVKANTSKNTFLFNGSIYSINSNDNITNILIKEINSYDKYAEIERVLSFPVGVVIRTGSIGSRVYTYDNNILENGMSVSNIIIEGEIFESPKKEIIVGKDLANYLNLKVGDALSLIAKASRGWLETAYFYVAGIYDLKDKNYDIIGDSEAMNSFIYLKEGDKSPYNESIIVFSENKDIYSSLNESSVINDYGLEILKPDIKNNISIKNIIILFIIIFAFSISLLSSSILSIFYRRLAKFIDLLHRKSILYTSFIISLLISIIISMLIIYFFMLFSFKFLVFTISIILLSFILSLLISNYNDNI
ncbi:hypothetical protein [Brachyspira alvinipulli]|uniref:hypothetical protein n=1 Tax=Brachyspira alvinipulli TaxID=84379 RepID=UPI000481882E|nr:hypothetical protein [Brachyspira alvinipulli]